VQEANHIFEGHTRAGLVPENWDGHAAERIVEVLLNQPDSCSGKSRPERS
jgi:hypothetical protein